MNFFPSCRCVSTNVSMHHLDPNEKQGGKARLKLLDNATVFIKSWKLHPTKQQLYDHLLYISKAIQDEKNTLSIAGEVRINSYATFSYVHLYLDTPGYGHWMQCNIMIEGFRFIYLAFGFS